MFSRVKCPVLLCVFLLLLLGPTAAWAQHASYDFDVSVQANGGSGATYAGGDSWTDEIHLPLTSWSDSGINTAIARAQAFVKGGPTAYVPGTMLAKVQLGVYGDVGQTGFGGNSNVTISGTWFDTVKFKAPPTATVPITTMRLWFPLSGSMQSIVGSDGSTRIEMSLQDQPGQIIQQPGHSAYVYWQHNGPLFSMVRPGGNFNPFPPTPPFPYPSSVYSLQKKAYLDYLLPQPLTAGNEVNVPIFVQLSTHVTGSMDYSAMSNFIGTAVLDKLTFEQLGYEATPEEFGYTVTFASGTPSPNITPEPSSIALLLMALAVGGLVVRLRQGRGKGAL